MNEKSVHTPNGSGPVGQGFIGALVSIMQGFIVSIQQKRRLAPSFFFYPK
jgi:hypothetical protein